MTYDSFFFKSFWENNCFTNVAKTAQQNRAIGVWQRPHLILAD
jgi:hypothetical protein